MTEFATSWYIATVWMAPTTYDDPELTIVRLQAVDVEDYRVRVQALWPTKVITFGPVSRSKRQTS